MCLAGSLRGRQTTPHPTPMSIAHRALRPASRPRIHRMLENDRNSISVPKNILYTEFRPKPNIWQKQRKSAEMPKFGVSGTILARSSSISAANLAKLLQY